jgi:hypothetical protein
VAADTSQSVVSLMPEPPQDEGASDDSLINRAKDKLDLEMLMQNSPEARELAPAEPENETRSGCMGLWRAIWRSPFTPS